MSAKLNVNVFRLFVLIMCAVVFVGCQEAAKTEKTDKAGQTEKPAVKQEQPSKTVKQTPKKDPSVSLYVDAITLSETNNPDLAIAKLNEAVQSKPDFALAYSLMGNIYLRQSRFSESVEAYKKATELNPWSFDDFCNLGRAYRGLEDFNSAAGAYAKACSLDPQNTSALCSAAEAYYKIGDYESALEFGKTAKDLDPTDSDIEKLMGDIYTARKDTELAIESYKKAVELDGSDMNAKFSLGTAYLQTGKLEEARTQLEAVVAMQPQNTLAFRHLGYVYLKLREIDLAVGSYEKAVAVSPDDWRAQKGLGVAYMMKYRIQQSFDAPDANELKQKALMHWSKSLDLNPTQDNLLKLYRKYQPEK